MKRSRAARQARVLAFCLGAIASGQSVARNAVAVERPRYGGSAVVAGVGQVPSDLDPTHLDSSLALTLSRAVYDTLFRIGRDGRARPHLVVDWSVDADSRVWSFTLRPGVKFHDGRTLSSSDVAFSLKRYAASSSARGGCLAPPIAAQPTIAEEGRLKLRVELVAPCGSLPDELADPHAGIVPASARDASGPATAVPVDEPGRGMGSGAYRLASVSRGTSPGDGDPQAEWALERNDAHVLGRPFLDRVSLRPVSAETDLHVALRIGSVDAVVGRSRLPEDSGRWSGGGEDTVFLVLDPGTSPFDKAGVRSGIASAVDRSAIAEVLLGGRARPARSALPEDRAPYRTLLSGFDAGSDALKPETRSPLLLAVPREDFELVETAERVQADLQEAGLLMRVQPVASSELEGRLARGGFGAALVSVRFGDTTVVNVFPRWLAGARPPPSELALARALDALRARTLDASLRGLLAAEQAVRGNGTWVPLVHRELGVAVSEGFAASDVLSDGSMRLESCWRRPAAPELPSRREPARSTR